MPLTPTLIIFLVFFLFGYLIGKSVFENKRYSKAARSFASIVAGGCSMGIFIGLLMISEAVG